ncbi:MAG TPA: restriction endonuclease subunit S [Stenotrophomonas sp.]
MSELPSGWSSSPLSEVCRIVRGVTYNKSQASDLPNDGMVPVLRANNIQPPTISYDDLVFVPETCVSQDQMIIPGDIVIAMSSGSRSVVGKAAQSSSNWNGSFGAFCAVLRPSGEMHNAYIGHFCRSKSYRDRTTELAAGVNINNLKPSHFDEIEIQVPPYAEQASIAKALDGLLAQVDTLKARLDALPALIKRFRQSILTSSVSYLAADWLPTPSSTWEKVTLGEISEVATGKTPSRSNLKYWESGSIPWLTSAATGAEFCCEAGQFVTEQAVQECNLKLFLPGTLLMAMYGEGKTRGQVTELKIAATCNQACAAISVNQDLARTDFVKMCLLKKYEEIRKSAAGGAQPNLNLNKIREIQIDLPSLEEQGNIIDRVEQLFTFADQLEARLADARQRVDALTQSILAKAFRGELVPQDPNDEPASVLLERIAAQRAADPKPKRGRAAKATS